MARFPQELYDQICGYLPSEALRRVSYVSTAFRKSAEDQAGMYRTRDHEISTDIRLDKFINYYSGFRLRYLRHVQLDVRFPDPEDEDRGCRESAKEQYQRDMTFTEQVRMIFETLQVIEDRAGERNRGNYQLTICVNCYVDEYCLHRQHAQWRTHLLESKSLPKLMSVTSLQILNETTSAKLDYPILIDLGKQLPNLEDLECHMGQDEWTPSYSEEPASLFVWEYDGPRRDTRHDFSKALTSNMNQRVRRVDLDFLCRGAMMEADRINHCTAMPNLASPFSKDPFSSSLRIMSYHLREMTIRAQVDETLFWPGDGSAPHWPYLEYVFLLFHTVSPSGAWYFEGPRGEGRQSTGYEIDSSSYPPMETTEDDEMSGCQDVENDRSFQYQVQFWYRISPNERVLAPFLESFAKAAAHMPELKRAVVWSPLRWDVDGDSNRGPAFDYFEPPKTFYPDYSAWGFAYYAPGPGSPFATNPGETDCKARQIWWKVGDWRPSVGLHSAFQQIGFHKYGEELKEYWDDDEFGNGLVSRDYFERFTRQDY